MALVASGVVPQRQVLLRLQTVCWAAVAYALGLSVPFFAMVLGIGTAGRWSFARRHQRALHLLVVAGLVAVGVTMVTGAWTDLVRRTVLLAG